MTRRTLPSIKALSHPSEMDTCPVPIKAFDKWTGGLTLASAGMTGKSGKTTIDILDVIGTDPWTGEGVDTAFVMSKLRSAGDVTVNINSPGGSYFEGAAIYELLRAHSGFVTVNILGIAASAASIIAMAGDEIRIGQTGFIMIHNCFGVVVGDRNAMLAAAKTQSEIDLAMMEVYTARTRLQGQKIFDMMNAETFISAKDSVASGFADEILPANSITADLSASARARPVIAQRKLEALMASYGLRREQRVALFNEFQNGGVTTMPRGMKRPDYEALKTAMRELSDTMDKHTNAVRGSRRSAA